jgi:gliding motility-associated-like protein
VSDQQGNLLFYTDGVTVYNKLHQVMANGNGLFGNFTSAHSATIIRDPGSTSLYYIFTLSSTHTSSLCFSLVDINLAAGNGSVVAKNVLIATNMAEKFSYTRHCNGVDWWLVTHDGVGQSFKSFLLTNTGVVTSPTVSTLGFGATPIPIMQPAYYCMKLSPNGKKLATSNSLFLAPNAPSPVELFDFDNVTGVVSNSASLIAYTWPNSPVSPYSCEFSLDGTKLYASTLEGGITQWDMCAGSNSAIASSSTSIVLSGIAKGGMQLAPDGKIYVARVGQTSLGVINNPNLSGSACNYVDGGFTIFGQSRYGLPNFSSVKPLPPPYTYTLGSCYAVNFSAPPLSLLNTYSTTQCLSTGYYVTGMQWYFDDPASGFANYSSLSNPSHTFSGLGIYNAKLVVYYSCTGGTDTIQQQVFVNQPCYSFTTSQITCSTTGTATFSVLGTGPFTYTWQPSLQTGSVATGLFPGTHTVNFTHLPTGWNYTATATFIPPSPLNYTASVSPSVNCFGATTGTGGVIAISGGTGQQSISWHLGATNYTTMSVSGLSAGVWTVQMTDLQSSCQNTQTFVITQPPAISLSIAAPSPSTCQGSILNFSANCAGGTPNYTFTWLPMNASGSITPIQSLFTGVQSYSLLARDSLQCTSATQVTLLVQPNPTLSCPSASFCAAQTGSLFANGASTYSWNTVPGTATFTDAPAVTTVYTVSGQSLGCTSNITSTLFAQPTPSIIVTSNSPICESKNLTLSATGAVSFTWAGPQSFYATNSSTAISSIALNQAGLYTVSALSANSCSASTVYTVQVKPLPILTALGSTVCTTQTLCLNGAANSATAYTWTGPNNFSSTQASVSIASPSLQQSGVYTLCVMAINGCTQTATANVDVMSPPSLSVALGTYSLCHFPLNGSPNTITVALSGASSYTLLPPNLFLISNVNGPQSSISVNVPGPSTVAAAVVTVVGSNNVCMSTRELTFTAIPNPTLSVVSSTPNLCAGLTVTYTSSGASAYLWSSSTPHFTSFIGNGSAIAQPHSSAQFSVLGSRLGCNSATQTKSIQVYPLPTLTLSTPAPSICLNASTSIKVTGSAANYQWLPNYNSAIINASTTAFSPTSSVIYTVIASANNCTNSAVQPITVFALPTAIIHSDKSKYCLNDTIRLYSDGTENSWWYAPNNVRIQAKNFTKIAVNLTYSGQYTLNVSDSNGCEGDTVEKIIVSALPSGQFKDLLGEACAPYCRDYQFVGLNANTILSEWKIDGTNYKGNIFYACMNAVGEHTLYGSLYDPQTTCHSDMNYQLVLHARPHAEFSALPQQPVEAIDEVQFTNKSVGEEPLQYKWFIDDHGTVSAKTKNWHYRFQEYGDYPVVLLAENKWACIDTSFQIIKVISDFNFFVPNSFTPNNDQLNDIFLPVGRGVQTYALRIYNRWGQEVFYSKDLNTGWDGRFGDTNCAQDTYNYTIEATSVTGEKISRAGVVYLVR